MLAMDVNENAPCLDERVVWTFIASMLAPTMGSRTDLFSPHHALNLSVNL
jgi:hypothetical protein